jgi:hypothetical protein
MSPARLVPFAAALAGLAAASAAFAQDPGAPPQESGDPVNDFRWAVYLACTLAFAAIVVYLVVTHFRAAKSAEAMADLERRLDALEGRPR